MRVPSKSETEADGLITASTFGVERRRAYEVAVGHWPTIELGFEQFCTHLDRLGYADELPKYTSSVYLCAACISGAISEAISGSLSGSAPGADAACKLLEATYFAGLERFISKFDSRPDIVEDLLQQLRTRLFVGPTARIASYQGRGSLQGWLRGVARSVAVDFLRARKSRREDLWCAFDGDVACSACSCTAQVNSPEEDYLLEKGTRTLLSGVRNALRAVDGEERQLLHHYFVSGLTIDALAPLYAVNRSTIARRILRIQARIRRDLRRELIPELGPLDAGELENWVPIVYQRLDVDAGVLLAGE